MKNVLEEQLSIKTDLIRLTIDEIYKLDGPEITVRGNNNKIGSCYDLLSKKGLTFSLSICKRNIFAWIMLLPITYSDCLVKSSDVVLYMFF